MGLGPWILPVMAGVGFVLWLEKLLRRRSSGLPVLVALWVLSVGGVLFGWTSLVAWALALSAMLLLLLVPLTALYAAHWLTHRWPGSPPVLLALWVLALGSLVLGWTVWNKNVPQFVYYFDFAALAPLPQVVLVSLALLAVVVMVSSTVVYTAVVILNALLSAATEQGCVVCWNEPYQAGGPGEEEPERKDGLDWKRWLEPRSRDDRAPRSH